MPGRAPSDALECLDLLMSAKPVDRMIVEWDDPSPKPGLRCTDHEASPNIGDLLHDE